MMMFKCKEGLWNGSTGLLCILTYDAVLQSPSLLTGKLIKYITTSFAFYMCMHLYLILLQMHDCKNTNFLGLFYAIGDFWVAVCFLIYNIRICSCLHTTILIQEHSFRCKVFTLHLVFKISGDMIKPAFGQAYECGWQNRSDIKMF